MRLRLTVFLAALLTASVSPAARASEAEDLFEKGRAALLENRLDAACDFFRRSQTQEAAPGTLLNLADCEERRGNRVLAHRLFGEVAAHAEPLFATEGKKRAETLVAQLAKVTVRIEGASPQGARLTLDGVEISANEPRLVEPGQHEMALSEPTRGTAETKRESLVAGQSIIVTLHAAAVDKPLGQPNQKPAAPTKRAPGVGVAGIAMGGVGVVTLATAVGTGIAMLNVGECFPAEGEPEGACDSSRAAADEGRALEAASSALFVVGGVLTATGIVLVAVAPWNGKPEGTTATLKLGPGHFQLGLSF